MAENNHEEFSDRELSYINYIIGEEFDIMREKINQAFPGYINLAELQLAKNNTVYCNLKETSDENIDELRFSMFELCPTTWHMQNPNEENDNLENISLSDRELLLLKAVFMGDSKVLGALIDLGVSVHATTCKRHLYYASENTMTPVMIATFYGFLPCLQILIDNCANVNAIGTYDVTALHLAAQNGYYNCLKTLLDAGANPNAVIRCSKVTLKDLPYFAGTTPLHLAVLNNSTICLKELLKYGADLNYFNEKNVTPLYIAAKLGYKKCLKILLKNNVSQIASLPHLNTGDIPLHFAVEHGMIKCVKKLLIQGSNVNHKNYAGNAPIHICLTKATCDHIISYQILKLLILCGCNTNVNMKNSLGLTPLHYVAFDAASVLIRRPDMANFLIGYGANIDIFNHQGVTLLKHEFNSTNPDVSILKTCTDTKFLPPYPEELKSITSTAQWLNNINTEQFYAMWMAISQGIAPPLDENVQLIAAVNPKTNNKEAWYVLNVPYGQIPSLQRQCRLHIRQYVGLEKLKFVKNLYIPKKLKSYLVYGTDYTVD